MARSRRSAAAGVGSAVSRAGSAVSNAGSSTWDNVTWRRSGLRDKANRWPYRWRFWIPLLATIAAIAAAFFWGFFHIQNDIEEAAPRILEQEGIDPSGLTFDATFRDVEVGGTLPAGVTAEQIEEILENNNLESDDNQSDDEDDPEGQDIRRATVTAAAAAAEAESDPDPEPEVAAVLGPIAVTAISDGDTITVNGTVPSDAHRDELIAAAEATGLTVVDEVTVSGLDPESEDADGQIARMSTLIGGLAAGSFASANLSIGDDGPVEGTIEALDATAAADIEALAGDGVEVTAPPELGNLDVDVNYDGTRIVLNGTVFDEAERDALVAAATDAVGASNVVDNLEISELAPEVEGTGDRVDAFAAAIATFGGLESADGSLNDTDMTVNGVATDEAGRSSAQDALAAAADSGVRPGGEITVAAAPEFTLAEETQMLQVELDALQEEIRENVVFDTNSDVLSPVAQETLDKVADAMSRFQRPVVEVGGHTDSVGDDAFNLDLSQRRATSVENYLISVGVDANRLAGIGFGETQPIADNLVEAGRQENRRVSFTAMEMFDQ